MIPAFEIDEASSNDTYLYVDIASRCISLQIKIEAEGVIVDAFPMNDCTGSDSLATLAVETFFEGEPHPDKASNDAINAIISNPAGKVGEDT